MKKKKLLLLLGAPLLLLASCSGGSGTVTNSYNTDQVARRYNISTDAGEDGESATISVNDPGSYDDTVTITKYVYDNSEEIPGFYQNGLITVESVLRPEIKTSFGAGYPIVGIGADAFASLSGDVTGIQLGSYVTSIGAGAFKDNASLSELNIESLSGLSYIGEGAFDSTPWYSTQLSAKKGAIVYGHVLYAFNGDTGESYEVPANIEMIAPNAFKGQTLLKQITFASGSKLREIGSSAFEGTGLTSVSLPESVEKIDTLAFASCPGLTSVDLGRADVEEDVLKDSDNITSLRYSGELPVKSLFKSSSSLGVLAKITSLGLSGDEVCENCVTSELTGLTSLSLKEAKVFREGALSGAKNAATVTDTDSVLYFEDNSLEDSVWYQAQGDGVIRVGGALLALKGTVDSVSLTGVTGVAEEALKGRSDITSLPETLQYVGTSAFEGDKGLTEIDLPSSKEVRNRAFASCTNVTKISLADYTLIGDTAVEQKDDWFDVLLAKKNALGNVDTVDQGATSLTYVFADDLKVTELSVPWGYSLTRLFDSNPMFSTSGSLISSLTKFEVKRGPYLLVDNFLQGASSITEFTFSDTIRYVGFYALDGLAVSELSIPSSVLELRRSSLQNCASLKTVDFEVEPYYNHNGKLLFRGVQTFGIFAFMNDTSLESTSINHGARKGGENQTGVFKFPESVRNVSGSLFFNVPKIQSIDLRMPSYYYDGVITMTDVRDDQNYIQFQSKDWNVDSMRKHDQYDNPYMIPYRIVLLDE